MYQYCWCGRQAVTSTMLVLWQMEHLLLYYFITGSGSFILQGVADFFQKGILNKVGAPCTSESVSTLLHFRILHIRVLLTVLQLSPKLQVSAAVTASKICLSNRAIFTKLEMAYFYNACWQLVSKWSVWWTNSGRQGRFHRILWLLTIHERFIKPILFSIWK